MDGWVIGLLGAGSGSVDGRVGEEVDGCKGMNGRMVGWAGGWAMGR